VDTQVEIQAVKLIEATSFDVTCQRHRHTHWHTQRPRPQVHCYRRPSSRPTCM